MKIVKIYGGLGNQMFQYAFYYAISKQYANDEILIDNIAFNSYKLHNGFELDKIYNLPYTLATKNQINRVSRCFLNYKLSRLARKLLPSKRSEYVEKNDYLYDDRVFSIDQDIYYEGYWQNELYFKLYRNDLINLFDINIVDRINVDCLETIRSTESVSIHVRRGDYLDHHLFKGIFELEYYRKSIDYISSKYKKPFFYIFSNDIAWCKLNILPLINSSCYAFVDWNTGANSFLDMHLMKCCKANIIANSSFSWWAAWLNTNEEKIIVAPKQWTNGKYNDKIQLTEWIKF